MGTYCYAMLGPTKTIEVTCSDARIRRAAIAFYHHKPTTNGMLGWRPLPKWEKLAQMQLAAMDKRWEDKELPPLMITVDKELREPRPDDAVYLCKRGSFYDGNEVLVGKVASVAKVKEGRKTVTHVRVNITHPHNLPQE